MPNLHGNFSAKSVTETVVNVPGNLWIALPTTAMSGRALIEVHNTGEHKMYFSFSSTATLKQRWAIGTGSFKTFPIQDNVTLFGRTAGGSSSAIITEYK